MNFVVISPNYPESYWMFCRGLKENGAKVSISANSKPEELKRYFEEVLPEFDKDRVYPTDIKKIINWYNIIIESGFDFEQEDNSSEENTEDNE